VVGEEVERAPGLLRSLVLLMKPGIVLSVTFTGFTGLVVAASGLPDPWVAAAAMVALVLSAAGAAVLNNVLDRGIDVSMKRLARRVEALRAVGERRAAAVGAAMIGAALLLSFLRLNAVAPALIALAVLSYTPLYTLYLKRESPFGTVLGGIPGALPVLIGYTAVDPTPSLGAYILFVFMILWQPPHFWALAQLYRSDYEAAGLPVMPVVYGSRYTNLLMLIYTVALVPITLSLWFFGYASALFALWAFLLGGYFVWATARSLRTERGYGHAFGVSILYVMGIMAALVVDTVLNAPGPV